ncbi:MAG: DNA polymerase IV [Planctomycetota bacterium]
MSAPPTILHVDMDAFFASVEVRDRPQLAGRPVAVGGSVEGRGVIAAASYEAREFGVRSALPTATAKRLCPELVLLPPDLERYTRESRRIMSIFRRYTPLVEPLSLDEAFLDVSGTERLFGDSIEVGRRIKAEILTESGLVASVGIAPSKFVAKLASDLDKPDGFRVIREHEVREILDPLPVSKIFGVGPRTAKRLENLGVHTVGQLAGLPREEVMQRFGSAGAWIHDLAHGIDTRRVNPRRQEKSHGMERTFAKDIDDREELRLLLFEFSEEVSHALRERGLRGRTITLKARFSDFRTTTRSKSLDVPVNAGKRIWAVARELLERVPPGPLRLLGVAVSNLEDVRAPVQAELFSDVEPIPAPAARGKNGTANAAKSRVEASTSAKHERLEAGALDSLRRRFGPGTVLPASLLGRPRHARTDNVHSARADHDEES